LFLAGVYFLNIKLCGFWVIRDDPRTKLTATRAFPNKYARPAPHSAALGAQSVAIDRGNGRIYFALRTENGKIALARADLNAVLNGGTVRFCFFSSIKSINFRVFSCAAIFFSPFLLFFLKKKIDLRLHKKKKKKKSDFL
jgi:hypothetical protein